MDAIVFSIQIPSDRHLVLDLPADTPIGQAEIIIRPQAAHEPLIVNSARETIRAKLLLAGKLITDLHAPEGAVPLSPADRRLLGQLPPGVRPSEDLIGEDRGAF